MRTVPVSLALFSLSALVSISGCSGGASLFRDGGGEGPEAGAVPDGGVVPGLDAGAPRGDLGPMALSPEGDVGATASTDYSGDALDSCYDGLDNNGDGHTDCGDPGCAVLPSCCPADGTACCDAPVPTTLPDFSSCSGTLVGCGLPGISLFGTGLPHADPDGLFPGGDRTNEGGLVLATDLDRTRATTIHATVALPTAAECVAPCIDTIALGLITDATLGATSLVRPVVAVVASASLQEVMVMSGDVVLASTPVAASSMDVVLTLSASGDVTAAIGTAVLTATVPLPTSPLHLAVYGHNENRAGVLSSHITSLTLSQSVCDAPSIWATRNAVTLGGGSSSAPAVLDGPSVAYSPTDARLAFATSAGILVAHRTLATGTPGSYALQSGFAAPDVANGPGETLADPELHFLPAAASVPATWRLYVANRATGGIEVVAADDAATLTFGAPTPMLLPSDLPGATITALDGPSVVLDPSPHDALLAARARYADGHSAIVLLHSADGLAHWDWLSGDAATSTVTVPSGLSDVAHDEVTSPSLVRRNGGWELYYSGRTLGRTAIGLMLSDDLVHWRAAPTAAVLAATGAPLDFDAFGVRDPGVGLVAGDEGRIELFYAGTDGVTTRLGRVERAATTVDSH